NLLNAFNGLLHASGNFFGSVKATVFFDANTFKPLRATITMSGKKKYGVTILGNKFVDGGDGNLYTIVFTITDERKVREAIDHLVTIHALVGSTAVNPLNNIISGPYQIFLETIQLISLFDSYKTTVDRVKSVKLPFALNGFG